MGMVVGMMGLVVPLMVGVVTTVLKVGGGQSVLVGQTLPRVGMRQQFSQ